MNIKRTLGIAYIIAGLVWAILNLPNLMARSKGNAIIATGLSVARILFWPIFLILVARGKSQAVTEDVTEGASNEGTTPSAD